MPPVYRTRRTKKGVTIVRKKGRGEEGGQLSGVGLAGFHKPKLAYRREPVAPVRVLRKRTDRIFDKRGGRKPSDFDTSTVKHTFRSPRIVKTGDGRTIEMTIGPGEWADNYRARVWLDSKSQSRVRRMFRTENRSRGRRGYAQRVPHLLGATAILSIGNKFLVIPNRGNTRLYDGFFHSIGGTVETKKGNFPKRAVSPARQAINELVAETGIKKDRLSVLNRGFKPTTDLPNADAIAFARSLEKVDPSADLVYAVRANTTNPDNFVRKHFTETGTGKFKLKGKPVEDEAAYFAIIPRTRRGIASFIRKNEARITPVFRIALEAYKNELPA
jgi:hypothetical protein